MREEGVKRSDGLRRRFLSTILTRLPGAWFNPSAEELVTLYRLRYRMAMEERKYDTALIFLNKILEVAPLDLDAKLAKGEIYHHHLRDFTRAVEQYNKVLKLSSARQTNALYVKARTSLAELMELLS